LSQQLPKTSIQFQITNQKLYSHFKQEQQYNQQYI